MKQRGRPKGTYGKDLRCRMNTTVAGRSYMWLLQEQDKTKEGLGRIIDRLILEKCVSKKEKIAAKGDE